MLDPLKELVLALEAAIDVTDRQIGRLCDRRHRETIDAVFSEDFFRGLHNLSHQRVADAMEGRTSTFDTHECSALHRREKLHRMVATAMKDDRQVYNVHVERMICIVANVVDDGAKQGVFEVSDVVLAAIFAMTAMSRFFNPLMIALSANKPEPTLDQMIDFVMGAFTPRAGKPAKIPRAAGNSRPRAAQLPFVRMSK
jgi:hypothetical protein